MNSERPADFCPYKGLQPYEEEDREYFFGRERDTEIIISNLYASPLTVLYGASGVGKSSVLLAGVAPRLKDAKDAAGVAAVIFREWQNKDFLRALKEETLRAVREKCKGVEVDVDPTLPLDKFLRRCSRTARLKLFFILDQFEEYFLYHPASSNGDGGDNDFEAQFARTVNRPDISANFLLALRDDGLSKLDRFQGRIPNMMGNLLRLEHLDARAAQSAICEPLRRYNSVYEPQPPASIEGDESYRPDGSGTPTGLIARLLEDLKAGKVKLDVTGQGRVSEQDEEIQTRIETPFLQMVLTRLWDERSSETNALELATYERLGGAQTIVRTHLDKVMAEKFTDDASRDIAARLFHHLVTPSGMKIALNQDDLAFYIKEQTPRVEPVVNLLSASDVRILRPVDVKPGQQSPQRYEIFHDVLAPAILDWRTRHEATKEAEKLRAKAEKQAEKQRLLLIEAEAKAEEERQRAEEQRRLAESERVRAEQQQRLAEVESKRAEEQARLVEVEVRSRLEHVRAARRARWAALFLAILSILAIATTAYAFYSRSQAEQAKSDAEQARSQAIASKEYTDAARVQAVNAKISESGQRQIAEQKAKEADEQRQVAVAAAALAKKSASEALEAKNKEAAAKQKAEEQARLADENARKAEEAKQVALEAEATARANADEAYKQQKIADTQRDLAVKAHETDKLYRQAFHLSRSGDRDEKEEAIGKFTQALDIYSKKNEQGEVADPQAVTDTFLNIGGIYTDLGNETKATEYFQKAETSVHGDDEKVSILTVIGDNYKKQSTYSPSGRSKAVEYYKRALDLYASMPDKDAKENKEKQAGVWLSIAEASTGTVERRLPSLEAPPTDPWKEVFAAFENAVTLYKEAGNHKKEAAALTGAGLRAQRQYGQEEMQKQKRALQFFNRAQAAAHEAKDPRSEIEALKNVISTNRALKQEKAADELTAKLVELYRAAGDKTNEAETLLSSAMRYVGWGRFTESQGQEADTRANVRKSIELLRRAASLFYEAGDKKRAAEMLGLVGGAYDEQLKEPGEAAKAYREALEKYREVGEAGGEVRALTSLAELAAASGNKPEAKEDLEQSAQVLQRLPRSNDKFFAMVSIGSGYLALQDLDTAADYFQKVIDMVRQPASSTPNPDDPPLYYSETDALVYIGRSYASHGFTDKALDNLNKAVELARAKNSVSGEVNAFSQLAEVYIGKKDYKKAIEYYEQMAQRFRAVGYTWGESNALMSISRIYRENLKDIKKAEEYERRSREPKTPPGGGTLDGP